MDLLQPGPRPLRGDALIIVPPFAALERPALGPHLLQSCAKEAGFEVRILYTNLLLAAEIGELNYTALCYSPLRDLMGERFFAAAAYGTPPLGRLGAAQSGTWLTQPLYPLIEPGEIGKLEATGAAWVDELVASILTLDFDIIGCSTTFQQTAASVALLKRLKTLRPGIVTILGGANCEGGMAEGILSLDGGIDFVFSGESESSFPGFLRDARAGHLPSSRVVHGQPCTDLDRIPTPDFGEYYQQLERFLPERQLVSDGHLWLPYESSRGCWWGEKHHCTFCGLNGQSMAFRAKSPDRVIAELTQLLAAHPSNRVTMVDNIMPHHYFRELIPRLGTTLPGLHLFYEQKANLTLSNVVGLRQAGFAVIQPGIEALSTSLLKRMDKGVTARQNIALLRYARSVDLSLSWNLLYQIPGDRLEEYQQTLDLLPLLRHLHPPSGLLPLMIDRFSPYFDNPAKHRIGNLRPWDTYSDILPVHAEVAKVAYHFDGDYDSESRDNPAVMRAIAGQVDAWRHCWESDGPPPALAVVPITGEQFLLHDTRGIPGTLEIQFLTREQASVALAGARDQSETVTWALQRRLLVSIDSSLVPLATAEPGLIEEFEAEARRAAIGRPALPATDQPTAARRPWPPTPA
jgi:ribosomal peptide maturation radical SAM protein 1